MSKYRALTPVVGIQHIDHTFAPDAVARCVQGTIVEAVDPYWGGGEFMYVQFSTTVTAKALCIVLPVFNATTLKWDFIASEAPSTAIMGQMLGVAQMPAVAGNFGWIQIGGLTPVKSNAAVAADTTFSIAATGQGGATVAGKQVVNARIVGASTITKVSAATGGVTGGFTVQVNNTDGMFVGAYLSGTGIGAAAIISAISNDERLITVTVANTANPSGNITATYNNAVIFYNVALLNRPFAQGAIT